MNALNELIWTYDSNNKCQAIIVLVVYFVMYIKVYTMPVFYTVYFARLPNGRGMTSVKRTSYRFGCFWTMAAATDAPRPTVNNKDMKVSYMIITFKNYHSVYITYLLSPGRCSCAT